MDDRDTVGTQSYHGMLYRIANGFVQILLKLNFQPQMTGTWSDFWQILIGNGPIKDGSKHRECVIEA